MKGKKYQILFRNALSSIMEQSVRELAKNDENFLFEEEKESEKEFQYMKTMETLTPDQRHTISSYVRQKDKYVCELQELTYFAGMRDMLALICELCIESDD